MKSRISIWILLSVLCSLGCIEGTAQTCCSAGAQLSNMITINSGSNRSIALNVGYEYKGINLLIDNGERLTNDPRSRYGQNVAFKLDYILNEKWALSTIIPIIHQSRSTTSITESTLGIGDVTVIGQYSLLTGKDMRIAIAGGVQLPLGITSHRNALQILMSPDMQSGSGTYDFMSSINFGKSHFLIPFLGLNLEVLYRNNTVNDSFGATDTFNGRMFGFGDEVITAAVLNYLWVLESGFLSSDVGLKYRHASANIENGVNAPNSGGHWLSLPLGLSLQSNESTTTRIYSEIPLYQQLEGLQITTSFTIGVQVRYLINTSL